MTVNKRHAAQYSAGTVKSRIVGVEMGDQLQQTMNHRDLSGVGIIFMGGDRSGRSNSLSLCSIPGMVGLLRYSVQTLWFSAFSGLND